MKRINSITIIFALFSSALFAQSPVEGLLETQVSGLVAGNNSIFHFYTADGKLYRGHNEVFIALTDEDGNYVEDFSVNNFTPIMDMGMSKHSTPIGKVEKVAGKPLYRTWFSFLMYTGQMDGAWALTFDYEIGETTGQIEDAVLQVQDYPANSKGIQSFNSNYYASLANPLSYASGNQTLQAHINLSENNLLPYQIVEGGYRIVVTPYMVDMGHGSDPATATLLWNAGKNIYEGAVNFGMEGNWRLYFKVLKAADNALVAGEDGTDSPLYWDVVVAKAPPASAAGTVNALQTRIYPTVTANNITVETPVTARVSIFNIAGQGLQSRIAVANTPLNIELSSYGKGVYLVSVKAASGEAFTRKVIVK
jgi:hypothetical protein